MRTYFNHQEQLYSFFLFVRRLFYLLCSLYHPHRQADNKKVTDELSLIYLSKFSKRA